MQKALIIILIVTNVALISTNLLVLKSYENSASRAAESAEQVVAAMKDEIRAELSGLKTDLSSQFGERAGRSVKELRHSATQSYDNLSTQAQQTAAEIREAAAPLLEQMSQKMAQVGKELEQTAQQMRETVDQEVDDFNQQLETESEGTSVVQSG